MYKSLQEIQDKYPVTRARNASHLNSVWLGFLALVMHMVAIPITICVFVGQTLFGVAHVVVAIAVGTFKALYACAFVFVNGLSLFFWGLLGGVNTRNPRE